MQEIVQKWQFGSLRLKAEGVKLLFLKLTVGQFTFHKSFQLSNVNRQPSSSTANRQPSTVNRQPSSSCRAE
jgi:hypothetical protein